MPSTLAQKILATAKRHEESYDRDAADAAIQDSANYTRTSYGPLYCGPDYKTFYREDIMTAAKAEAGEDAYPVYLLLSSNWNDALDWANNPNKEAY